MTKCRKTKVYKLLMQARKQLEFVTKRTDHGNKTVYNRTDHFKPQDVAKELSQIFRL